MKIDGSVFKGSTPYSTAATAKKEDIHVRKEEQLKSQEQPGQEQKASRLLEEEKKREITKSEAQHIVNGINEFLQPKMTSLSFKLHEDSDRFYVEVINQDSKEVIREIPEKELLDMYARMTEYLGLFIDEKL